MVPKFRAFYKANQKMYEVLTLDIIDEKTLIENNDNPKRPLRGYVKITEVELMQSTGLKDKNGVEIFEGDIVRAWSEGVYGNFQIKRRIDGLWLLYPAWKDRIFWYLRPTDDSQESCEILGNIYENSELLEV